MNYYYLYSICIYTNLYILFIYLIISPHCLLRFPPQFQTHTSSEIKKKKNVINMQTRNSEIYSC